MSTTLFVVTVVVVTALIFDFTNGFHDSSNAMATSVATSAAGSEPAPPPETEVALGLPVGVAGAPPVARGVDAMGSVPATVADSWLLLINRRVATTPIITNSAKRAARRRRR